MEHGWEFYRKVPSEEHTEAGAVRVSSEKINSIREMLKDISAVKERIERTFYGRTTDSLEVLIAGSLAVNASDIHIEPQLETARLRYRMDGVLQDVIELPKKLYTLLLSRIKLISEMKLNIHDQAQDGRFTIKTNIEIEVRASMLPGPYGENIVLRILNPESIRVTFEEMGMRPWMIKDLDRELRRPNGMILTTGPTGSGKTTTLYAFIQKVYNPEVKVITIEDPIEYHLKGIEQTQVHPEEGYDFARGLRSIVRQDPDVILVGEIRDLETAETAMNAALTGHLVFSTLHTNNAAGTVPRLINLGVNPAIIAPAINVSMAQRLVRRLCNDCKTKTNIGAPLEKRIADELKDLPKTIPLPPKEEWNVSEARTDGDCKTCNGIGYKGRIAVFEIILIDEKIQELILKSPSEYEIKREARRQGQMTLREDGILKIIAGVTNFNEVDRVIGTE
ncbi:MAG: hypothetical protein A2847_01895 [Candidatus Sungbacteria bacterium RIFCSPHIGHO2_01_FULL_50_25]|uniref:Bacterial type II secretion system protein E domain-containing protein n=1 Tax=Candidatus Sungbacteria bacterium RIFCSPHIGHO2_01_FULL_50_25 TaxID=1802265 RepID=A0A1G2K9L3_9BACT|nr:MAG: hypothetical protein A2847_01895 [Candidatus Sungbacteria bacterium RIFCSPHIGHO2_01_FULL_50_25]